MRQILRGTSDVWISIRAVIGIFLVAAVLILTLIAVTGHSKEISDIKALTQKTETTVKAIKKISNDRTEQNRQLAHDLTVVAQYAASLKAEIATNHTVGDANFAAICKAVPGCVLPTVTSTATP